MIVFAQNMHNVSLSREIIPLQCLNHNIRFYHIWLSNWNSFSFMRHFVPNSVQHPQHGIGRR